MHMCMNTGRSSPSKRVSSKSPPKSSKKGHKKGGKSTKPRASWPVNGNPNNHDDNPLIITL